jgi:hypothetical protein
MVAPASTDDGTSRAVTIEKLLAFAEPIECLVGFTELRENPG